MARSRRRGNLDDPALGRQRHDRALGRQPAGGNDARRCRAGARRRRSGAGSSSPTRVVGGPPRLSCEALRMRCSAQPIVRRTTSRRASRRGWHGGAAEVVIVAQAQLALLAAKQGGWGEAGRRARRGTSGRRRGRPRRLLVERARARGDGARRTPRGQTGGCPRGADARAPSAADARPRPPLADDPGRARAHSRPSRARRARRGPHGSQPRPSRCSSSVRIWARWSTDARELRERVAATAGSGGAWAMSLTGAELRLLPYLATHLMFPEIASQAVHLAQHRQERSGRDLPQARCLVAQ